jgi:dTDP-4-dehydrorhamnose reductase
MIRKVFRHAGCLAWDLRITEAKVRKIVLIGGNGQLGTDLARAGKELNLDLVSLTHSDIEITDLASIEQVLSGLRPEAILNTAGCHGAEQYTAADQEAFFRVNGLGALNLARFCRRRETLLVHYSTDYVFGRERARERPYIEGDPPCPINVYGASKLAGEYLIQALCPRHYLIRIASLYGSAGCRAKGNSNFVKMVLHKARRGENLKVVNDQFMSPTWTRAAAKKTYELINSGAAFGLYHMAGSGLCSWYEFAREILRIAGATIGVEPTATPAEGADEVFLRPRWTALDNAKLRQAALTDLPHWRECLEEYIRTEEKG